MLTWWYSRVTGTSMSDASSSTLRGVRSRRNTAPRQTISGIGSVVSGVGVGVYVYIETGSAAWLGVLSAQASLPYVLTAPLLPLTDRYRRRLVMIAADTFAVLGPTIALLLATFTMVPVLALYAWYVGRPGYASNRWIELGFFALMQRNLPTPADER